MKKLTYLMVALGLLAAPMCILAEEAEAVAEEMVEEQKAKPEKKAKKAKVKPVIKDLTIKGKVETLVKKGKDGKEDRIAFVLIAESGQKIKLPQAKKRKGDDKVAPAISLADYADANVTLTAKGIETKKGEKTMIAIKEVISIEKADAAE